VLSTSGAVSANLGANKQSKLPTCAAAYFIAARAEPALINFMLRRSSLLYTLRFYALDVLNYFMQLSLFYIAKRRCERLGARRFV
jgi:hypothetical protein